MDPKKLGFLFHRVSFSWCGQVPRWPQVGVDRALRMELGDQFLLLALLLTSCVLTPLCLWFLSCKNKRVSLEAPPGHLPVASC